MVNDTDACRVTAIVRDSTCGISNSSAFVGALIAGPPDLILSNYSGIELSTPSSGVIILRSSQRPRELFSPPVITATIVQGPFGTSNCSGSISIDCNNLVVDPTPFSTQFYCNYTLGSFVGTLCAVQVTSISRLGIPGTVGDVGVIVNTQKGIVAQPVVARPSYLIPGLRTSIFMNDTVPGAILSWPIDDLELLELDILRAKILAWNAVCFGGSSVGQNFSSAFVFDTQIQFHTFEFDSTAPGGGCVMTASASRFGVPTSQNAVFIGIFTDRPYIYPSQQYQYLRGLENGVTFTISGDFLPRASVDPGDGLGGFQEDWELNLTWRTHSVASGACGIDGQLFNGCSGANVTLPTLGNAILCTTYLNTNDSNCGLFATVRRGPLTSAETQIGLLQFIAAPQAPPVAPPVLPPQLPPLQPPQQPPQAPPVAAPQAAPIAPPPVVLPPSNPPQSPTPMTPPVQPPVSPPTRQSRSAAFVEVSIDAAVEPTAATLRLIKIEIASVLFLDPNVDIDVFIRGLVSTRRRSTEIVSVLVVEFLTPEATEALSTKLIAVSDTERFQIMSGAVTGAAGSTFTVTQVSLVLPPSFFQPTEPPMVASVGPLATDLPPGFLNTAGSSLGAGAIVGIVAACVAVIAVVIFIVVYMRARKRQRELEETAQELKVIENLIDEEDEEYDEEDEEELDSDELTSGSSYSYTSSSWVSDGQGQPAASNGENDLSSSSENNDDSSNSSS